MQKKDLKKLAYFAAGAVALEYILSKSSQQTADTVDTSVLDSLSQGVSNLVGTLTGNKYSDFLTKMAPITPQIQAQYGIDPTVTMSQAALESNWGVSGLTAKANNLYGFTGDAALNSWLAQNGLPTNTSMSTILTMDTSAAPFILMQTHEQASGHSQYFTRPDDIVSQSQNSDGSYDLMVWRPFRRYDSWLASVQDWAHLISTSSRYAASYAAARSGDINAFADAIGASGYATESDYGTQILATANKISDVQSA